MWYHKKKKKTSFPATKFRDMNYCNLTDKEFKIAARKKFSELQENSERPYNDLRNKQNNLPKRLKFWERTKQILELKHSVSDMNALEIIGSQAHQMEQRVNELMGKNIEMFQVEEERTKIFLKVKNPLTIRLH